MNPIDGRRFLESQSLAPVQAVGFAQLPAADPVPVAGVTPFTTIDYPEAMSAVLFLQGCPWKCPYCHNESLQPMCEGKMKSAISWQKVRAFLEEHQGLLDAIVFSGGEPTIHRGLMQAMLEVRSHGFKVGLHTNGAFPGHVQRLADEELLDWVGLDVKAPRWLYAQAAGVKTTAAATYETLRVLLQAGIPVDARTTVYRPLLDDEEILRLARELRELGARRLFLQSWRPKHDPGQWVATEDLTLLQADVDAILGYPVEAFAERDLRKAA